MGLGPVWIEDDKQTLSASAFNEEEKNAAQRVAAIGDRRQIHCDLIASVDYIEKIWVSKPPKEVPRKWVPARWTKKRTPPCKWSTERTNECDFRPFRPLVRWFCPLLLSFRG